MAVLAFAIVSCGDDDDEAQVETIPPEVSQNEDQWPLPNKDYRNTRTATNSQITSENVNDLGVAWSFVIPGVGGFGAAASNPVLSRSHFFDRYRPTVLNQICQNNSFGGKS